MTWTRRGAHARGEFAQFWRRSHGGSACRKHRLFGAPRVATLAEFIRFRRGSPSVRCEGSEALRRRQSCSLIRKLLYSRVPSTMTPFCPRVLAATPAGWAFRSYRPRTGLLGGRPGLATGLFGGHPLFLVTMHLLRYCFLRCPATAAGTRPHSLLLFCRRQHSSAVLCTIIFVLLLKVSHMLLVPCSGVFTAAIHLAMRID